MTPERALAVWKARSTLMDDLIITESARWGDYKRDLVPGRWSANQYQLYTKNDPYLQVQDYIFNTYIPERGNIVLRQLRRRNLFPDIDPPGILINGTAHAGGDIDSTDILTFSVSDQAGAVIYSLDGSDPRGAAPEIVIEEIVPETAAVSVLVPDSPAADDASPAWTETEFDDSAWMQGARGAGFDRGGDYNEHFGVDLIGTMWTKAPGAYLRVPFTVTDASRLRAAAIADQIRRRICRPYQRAGSRPRECARRCCLGFGGHGHASGFGGGGVPGVRVRCTSRVA